MHFSHNFRNKPTITEKRCFSVLYFQGICKIKLSVLLAITLALKIRCQTKRAYFLTSEATPQPWDAILYQSTV